MFVLGRGSLPLRVVAYGNALSRVSYHCFWLTPLGLLPYFCDEALPGINTVPCFAVAAYGVSNWGRCGFHVFYRRFDVNPRHPGHSPQGPASDLHDVPAGEGQSQGR